MKVWIGVLALLPWLAKSAEKFNCSADFAWPIHLPALEESTPGIARSRQKLYKQIARELKSADIDLQQLDFAAMAEFTREFPARRTGGAFATSNFDIYTKILRPFLKVHREALQKLSFPQRLNAIQLINFFLYDAMIGNPKLAGHFYRWGGDLFDIDEPQKNDIRTTKAYGLDCSGYVAGSFDTLLKEGLADDQTAQSPFLAARKNVVTGLNPGQTSDQRLNVKDLAQIGRELFDESTTPQERAPVRAGDYIVIPKGNNEAFPHVVSVVRMDDRLMIAESANSGSVTQKYINERGEFLPLEAALERLKARKVHYQVRRVD